MPPLLFCDLDKPVSWYLLLVNLMRNKIPTVLSSGDLSYLLLKIGKLISSYKCTVHCYKNRKSINYTPSPPPSSFNTVVSALANTTFICQSPFCYCLCTVGLQLGCPVTREVVSTIQHCYIQCSFSHFISSFRKILPFMFTLYTEGWSCLVLFLGKFRKPTHTVL